MPKPKSRKPRLLGRFFVYWRCSRCRIVEETTDLVIGVCHKHAGIYYQLRASLISPRSRRRRKG